jgi:hypothetical protein
MRELIDIWTRYEIYEVMFVWIQIDCCCVFLLRKTIRGVTRKIFRWNSKHKVKGFEGSERNQFVKDKDDDDDDDDDGSNSKLTSALNSVRSCSS